MHPDDSYRIPPNLLNLCGTKAPRSLEVLPRHIDKVCQIEKPEVSWLHADEKKPKLEGLPKRESKEVEKWLYPFLKYMLQWQIEDCSLAE